MQQQFIKANNNNKDKIFWMDINMVEMQWVDR